jgi:hypothetical protein
MYFALNAFKETLKCNTQVTLFKRITLAHFVFLGLQEKIRENKRDVLHAAIISYNFLQLAKGSGSIIAL